MFSSTFLNSKIILRLGNIKCTNVVGYLNAEKPKDTLYSMSGAMFVTPGNATWDLADMKLVDGNSDKDKIMFLQSDISVVDANKTFYYYGPDEAGSATEDIGWWYTGGDYDETLVESFPIPAGTGVLCQFNSENVKLLYSGEVIKGDANNEIAIEKAPGVLYFFVNNPTPCPVDLSTVKLVDGNSDKDKIMFMQADKSVVDANKTFYYYGPDEAGSATEDIGWWYTGGDYDETLVEEGDIILQPGEGFLCQFNSPTVKVVFPAPKF